ncbi:MAG: hypothetical protein M5U28_54585 [Sandaracinaceae bacterium]|nr:hypothetical protein [Sandaracinaceae bacterium]
MAPDAGSDAGTDAGLAGTPVTLECVPAVAGNETASGMVLSAGFWTGFRFQVSAGSDLTTTAIAINVRSSSAGTIFGAIVRLTSMTDAPDAADLTGGDVAAMTTLSVPGGPSSATVSAPITATLSPGWYAAVFGTGAFGATLASATVHSNSGTGGCGSGFGYPFTLRQSDGALILQAATPHFAVHGVRP